MLLLAVLFHFLAISNESSFVEREFEQFLGKYNKSYEGRELSRRMEIFRESLAKINHLNSLRTDNESAHYGITQYSDLTPREFMIKVMKKNKVSGSPRRAKHHRRYLPDYEHIKRKLIDVPKRWDWRDARAVTAVRNQGKCGACWAQSVVAAIESMVAIKTGKLTEFSIQQLVDCSKDENQGCHGGDTCSALIWMNQHNVTLETVNDYPNEDDSGECRVKPDAIGVRIQPNYTCESFVSKEHEMIKLLAHHGPLIAAVDASTWQHYLGGIIQYHCFNDLNHAVQITGYDLTGPIPYYIVRNTWDTGFGLDGYLHIAISNNLCGIAEEISAVDLQPIPSMFYQQN